MSNSENENLAQNINWRSVRNIDIDLIRSTNDLSTLEANLKNFIFSEITEEEISSVPEQNVVKLIKILQFAVKYLLNTQDSLENEKNFLQMQCNKSAMDLEEKEAELVNATKLINKLKKEKKDNQSVLITYKTVIQNLNRKQGSYLEVNERNININEQNKHFNQTGNPNISCPFCLARI